MPQDAESIDDYAGATQGATQTDANPVSSSAVKPGEAGESTAVERQGGASETARAGGLKLFLTTFVTIFVAELGDKTQVTTLLMSAESQAPLTVFLGSGSALILTTVIGLGLGRWLSNRVSVDTLETLTGAILAFIALLLLWDVVHL